MTQHVFAFTGPPVAELTVYDQSSKLMHVRPMPKSVTYPHGHMFIILGGTVVAQAKAQGLDGGESWSVRLLYHGGRRTWMVESEHHSPTVMYPRDDAFGPLWKMMGWFQKLTGLQLAAITIVELGVGSTEHTAGGATIRAENPWLLEPGEYEFMRGGMCRRVEALEERGHMVVRFTDIGEPSETIDPRLVLDASGWLTLRKVPCLAAGAEAGVAESAVASQRRARP